MREVDERKRSLGQCQLGQPSEVEGADLIKEVGAQVHEGRFDAGFRALEVPLNRPGALECIATLVAMAPADACIGAGTVTVNFSSETRDKSQTRIDDDASIGSDTMLVAPVHVGTGAMTGAGAVVTHDVPAGEVWVGAPARALRRRRGYPAEGGESGSTA